MPVGVAVDVSVRVVVTVADGVHDGVDVRVGDGVPLAVGVDDGMAVCVPVGVAVRVGGKVRVGPVAVGLAVPPPKGVGVGVGASHFQKPQVTCAYRPCPGRELLERS